MNKIYSLQRPPQNTPNLYDTDNDGDAYDNLVYAHYYLGGADWFVLEYDPMEDIMFCWAEIIPDCGELGYTSLKELEDLIIQRNVITQGTTQQFPFKVLYDFEWQPKSLRLAIASRQ